MIGLDVQKPLRFVQLTCPNEGIFCVSAVRIYDDITLLSSSALFSSPLIVALPDSQAFLREGKWTINTQSLHFLLSSGQSYAPFIYALDLESEALARALIRLCGVPKTSFAIIYTNEKQGDLWVSVFEHQKKIFFYQEKITDSLDNIIQRAFKLFYLQYPQKNISEKYILSPNKTLEKWGTIPEITQKICFNTEADQHLWQQYPARDWLLACGLSLWQEETSLNLLPDRKKEKQKKYQRYFLLTRITYSILGLLLLHSIMLGILFFEQEKSTKLEHTLQILHKKSSEVIHTEHQIQVLNNHIYTLQNIKTNQSNLIHFLNALDNIMPHGLALTHLEIQQNESHAIIILKGISQTAAQVNDFLLLLKQHNFINNVLLENITTQQNFSVKVEVKKS